MNENKTTSNFLSIIAANESVLKKWIMASVREMDSRVVRGFPLLFGAEWAAKFNRMSTPEKTKILTYVFNDSLSTLATAHSVSYSDDNADNTDGENRGYDSRLYNFTVENKLTLSKDKSSFGLGNKNTHENKVSRIFSVHLTLENTQTSAIFAGMIDISDKKNTGTGWHSAPGGGDSFSWLKIHRNDIGLVRAICGNVACAIKWVKMKPEKVE